ncbi:galactinol--sucrose galactosyltransferase [Quercus suber]|uniref:Galactinol--sucrose galactosyltransferase n=1 Tax=Quercus suber TaxID=58331 RepID=A0AAW0KHX8_QUESU
MGDFIHPDWDMFQSTHPYAEFHAASRAISGGPIYVSDSVGKHNFKLLKSLVLPDGSICDANTMHFLLEIAYLKTLYMMGKQCSRFGTLTKTFQLSRRGWCPQSRRNKSASQFSRLVTCVTSPKDIELNNGKHPISTKGVDIFAVYMFQEKKLKLLKSSET